MKRFFIIFLLLPIILAASSCIRDIQETYMQERPTLPEGTPVTLAIGFGTDNLEDIQIGTKAEVSRADESRIHDLYVLLFNEYGVKIYGRYFTYEHQYSILTDNDDNTADLLSQTNEGWYVDNLLRTETDPTKKTRGVVKISTVSASDCTLILLANISNTVASIKDPLDPDKQEHTALDFLSQEDLTLEDFNKANVTLEQNVVNRSNLFLMMGTLSNVDTGAMTWDKTNNVTTGDYGTQYRVNLTTMDAKIKFRIRYDETNISAITARHWQAFNLPDRCMLAPSNNTPAQIGTQFFNTGEAYFEGTETDASGTWQVFSFYMLETKPEEKKHATSFYLRDKLEKNTDGTNKDTWEYAPQTGTYVKFDLILTLTTAGIRDLLNDPETNHALTSDAIFTVHLGDFTSSESGSGHNYDNYKVERGHFYTYNIVIQNSKSIYAEVMSNTEDEPGHEGSLLLTTDDVINCDAHYEYHNVVFKANPALAATNGQNKLSWYIKTPFTKADEGRPVFKTWKEIYDAGGSVPDGFASDNQNGQFIIPTDASGLPLVDYEWVKFGLNKEIGTLYTDKRFPYPGDNAYDPDWIPREWNRSENPVPPLIDVNQLINLLFDQNVRRANSEDNLFDSSGELCFTAFVNEYYYEVNPLTGELETDLWRDFINAKPRELHILSEATYSEDLQSDVITSNHTIIQNSIQTFYNTYSPDLTSIWGTEHTDEMRNRGAADASTGVNRSWSWWHGNWTPSGIIDDEENGRLNTANIWGMDDAPTWDTFLNYEVENDMPDLRSNYQYMAYSCLSRNRDNNGNGVIDPEELRWYTAAINQLIGMWVGNESLSQTARLYQPIDANSQDPLKWRAHVLSSTCTSGKDGGIDSPRVIRGEEGATKSFYSQWDWAFPDNSPEEYRDRVSSIRCVRNAGTFRQGGKDTDISYAPYDRMVDQYYEIPAGTDGDGHAFPNSDGTYTVRFSRLNPKSIRDYTSEDLPYHEENSFHNRVYMELNMQAQAPADAVVADLSLGMTERNLNNAITNTGHNTYCPPGYRLPNMTELLVMSTVMPTSYWGANNTLFPCRTYFSRGIIGSNQISTENGTAGKPAKIGWQYSNSAKRVNIVNDAVTLNSLRCVRDKEMTGDITGKIIVDNYDKLSNCQTTRIELNFSSIASAIRSVECSLVYTDATGEHSIRIDEADGVTISGVTVNDQFDYTVPAAGTGKKLLPVRGWMKVRAVVTNAAGMERTFETPVRVLSEMNMSIKLLPCDYDGRSLTDDPYPFPVLLTAYDKGYDITSWKLKIVSPDKATQTVDLGTPNARYTTTVYNYSPATLLTGTYTFQLEATGAETVRSEIVSMDVIKVNYRPVETSVIDAATQASDLTVGATAGRWERQMISGLDFVAGDFIETDMDIHLCEFKPDDTATTAKEHNNRDLGMDILLSIGLNGIDWVPWVLNVDFPSVANGPEGLYINPTWLDLSKSNKTNNAGYIYCYPDREVPAHFRLESGGAYWNGQKIDVSRWGTNQTKVQSVIDKLTSANNLYIGSTEGYHRSRAEYRFVRVVHNGRDSTTERGDSNFKENPGNGGQL